MTSIRTSLGWLGFEGETGLGEERLDEGGPVLGELFKTHLFIAILAAYIIIIK